MSGESPLVASPDYTITPAPCGCCGISFPGRVAIAVPCGRHAGTVRVTFDFEDTPPPPTKKTTPLNCPDCGSIPLVGRARYHALGHPVPAGAWRP